MDSVVSLNTVNNLYYTIGDPIGVLSYSYAFSYTPVVCGYEITYTIVGQEDGFEHQEGSKNFIVAPSDEKSLAGVYPVSIVATVNHLADHTATTTTSV